MSIGKLIALINEGTDVTEYYSERAPGLFTSRSERDIESHILVLFIKSNIGVPDGALLSIDVTPNDSEEFVFEGLETSVVDMYYDSNKIDLLKVLERFRVPYGEVHRGEGGSLFEEAYMDDEQLMSHYDGGFDLDFREEDARIFKENVLVRGNWIPT